VETRQLGDSPLLPAKSVEAELLRILPNHFPSRADVGTPGLKLAVEYAGALSDSDDGDGAVYFGIRGFMEQLGTALPLVLETDLTHDVPLPRECSGGNLKDQACVQELLARVVRPAFQALAGRLSYLCTLEICSVQELKEDLASDDPWKRGQAARTVGERKMHELAAGLVALASEDDGQVALPAIAALGRLKYGEATSELVARTQGAREPVIRAVAGALADIGTPEARRYLKEWASYHAMPSIRELSAELLE